jgi:hypothetical protein
MFRRNGLPALGTTDTDRHVGEIALLLLGLLEQCGLLRNGILSLKFGVSSSGFRVLRGIHVGSQRQRVTIRFPAELIEFLGLLQERGLSGLLIRDSGKFVSVILGGLTSRRSAKPQRLHAVSRLLQFPPESISERCRCLPLVFGFSKCDSERDEPL